MIRTIKRVCAGAALCAGLAAPALAQPAPAEAAPLAVSASGGFLQGCEGAGDIKLFRRDDFNRALAHAASGVGAEPATYRLTWRTRYWYCRQVVDPNKIYVDSRSFCVEKTNSRNPNFDHQIRGFWSSAIYDTLSNLSDPHPIDTAQINLNWNGVGQDGDRRCTNWVDVTSSANRWMKMPNNPYVKAQGHVDIANAIDDVFDYYDPDQGTKFHGFRPESDPDVPQP